MRISIAMATYNGARFIREQLDSLAAQTLLPCELVVCDDGSSDATLSIVEDFARAAPFPVHVHRNEKRLGYADNFLKAASLCVGDYVAFCDQDDVWLAEKLAICSKPLCEAGVTLVVHQGSVVLEDLTPRGARFPKIAATGVVGPMDQSRIFRFKPPGFVMTFRRGILTLIHDGVRPCGLRAGQILAHDHFIYMVSASIGRVAYLRDVLVQYRQHSSNTCGAEVKEGLGGAVKDGLRSHSANEVLASAQACRQWASYLVRASAGATEYSARCEAAAGIYNAFSKKLTNRSRLYSSSVVGQRWVRLLTDICRGRYWSPGTWGLGWRALAKDTLACFAIARGGRKKPHLSSNAMDGPPTYEGSL